MKLFDINRNIKKAVQELNIKEALYWARKRELYLRGKLK